MQYNDGEAAKKRKKGFLTMSAGFIKDLFISLLIGIVLLVVSNILGELAIQPRAVFPPPQEGEEQQTEEQAPQTVAHQDEQMANEEATEPAPAATGATESPAEQSLSSLIAAYDPKAGAKAFRKCVACHTFEKDKGNRVGPNLWGVVGREKGTAPGYKYSDAMKLKGGSWTYEELNRFLTNPRTFIIGTKMSLKGYKDIETRATLIGFLRTLSDAPKALPE